MDDNETNLAGDIHMLSMKPSVLIWALLAPATHCLADDQETQQLHNNTYQQYVTKDCTTEGDCAVFFPATTHITTAISNASCYFAIPSGAILRFASVGSTAANARFYIQPVYISYADGYSTYQINAIINLYVAKGDAPRIDVYSTGGAVQSLNCTISGYHS